MDTFLRNHLGDVFSMHDVNRAWKIVRQEHPPADVATPLASNATISRAKNIILQWT